MEVEKKKRKKQWRRCSLSRALFHASARPPPLSTSPTRTGVGELEPHRKQPLIVERSRDHDLAERVQRSHLFFVFPSTLRRKQDRSEQESVLDLGPFFSFFLHRVFYTFTPLSAAVAHCCGASAEILLESSSSETEGIGLCLAGGAFVRGAGAAAAATLTFGLRSRRDVSAAAFAGDGGSGSASVRGPAGGEEAAATMGGFRALLSSLLTSSSLSASPKEELSSAALALAAATLAPHSLARALLSLSPSRHSSSAILSVAAPSDAASSTPEGRWERAKAAAAAEEEDSRAAAGASASAASARSSGGASRRDVIPGTRGGLFFFVVVLCCCCCCCWWQSWLLAAHSPLESSPTATAHAAEIPAPRASTGGPASNGAGSLPTRSPASSALAWRFLLLFHTSAGESFSASNFAHQRSTRARRVFSREGAWRRRFQTS